jgi:hypothetical protein
MLVGRILYNLQHGLETGTPSIIWAKLNRLLPEDGDMSPVFKMLSLNKKKGMIDDVPGLNNCIEIPSS